MRSPSAPNNLCVFVFMCMSVCVSLHVCLYVYAYICGFVRVPMCILVCVSICMLTLNTRRMRLAVKGLPSGDLGSNPNPSSSSSL